MASLFARGRPHLFMSKRRLHPRLLLEVLEDRLTPAGDPFMEPPVIASDPMTHVLTATLTEIQGPATVGDTAVVNAWTYQFMGTNNYVGPTLLAQPGDTLDITIVNQLPDGQPTNLHTHGLHVSPLGNSDNILLEIEPGEDNHYHIVIPSDHPEGLYWYHPHHHGFVNDQISLGLSGLLVIGHPDGGATQLSNQPQHLVALKNALLAGNQINVPAMGSDVSAQTFTVNGQLQPVLTVNNSVANNQWQVFNVGNIGNNAFYDLQVFDTTASAVVPILALANDGNPFTKAQQQTHVGAPPGRRWSFLVPPPNDGVNALPHTYVLRTLGFNGNFPNSATPDSNWPATDLMTINYTGTVALQAAPVTNGGTLSPPNNYFDDLSMLPIAASRTVVFGEDGMLQTLNGQPFPNGALFQPRLGTVEEWTLINSTGTDHPFHLHVDPQQTTNPVGGLAPRFQDVINVQAGQTQTIRVRFDDFLGEFVYHCHRVDHEDMGMMALVNVLPNVPFYAIGVNGGGTRPKVKVFDPVTDTLVAKFLAYSPTFGGGVNVAVGDVNGDGVYDVITGKGSGKSLVKVIDGTKLNQVDPETNEILDSALLGSFFAYSPVKPGGVFVAVGDINSDGLSDVITGTGPGPLVDDPNQQTEQGSPRVKVVDATMLNQVDGNGKILPSALLDNFLAYGSNFIGGVRVACGDVNGDGRFDIITGRGPGGDPLVKIFTGFGADRAEIGSFFAYSETFTGGVYVATGKIKGFAFDDIITGRGEGGDSLVRIFSNDTSMMGQHELNIIKVDEFFAYGPNYTGGVKVTSLHDNTPLPMTGGNRDDVVTTKTTGEGLTTSIFSRDIPPPP